MSRFKNVFEYSTFLERCAVSCITISEIYPVLRIFMMNLFHGLE